MAKSQQTFNKKEREKKRRKRKQDKLEKKEQRKNEKDQGVKKSFEELFVYVDENGNLSSTKPDPTIKKPKVKAEDIVLGATARVKEDGPAIRKGRVKFFNEEKGYGFIVDNQSSESVFVHANSLSITIRENDKVQFETEKGLKGPQAVNVVIDES